MRRLLLALALIVLPLAGLPLAFGPAHAATWYVAVPGSACANEGGSGYPGDGTCPSNTWPTLNAVANATSGGGSGSWAYKLDHQPKGSGRTALDGTQPPLAPGDTLILPAEPLYVNGCAMFADIGGFNTGSPVTPGTPVTIEAANGGYTTVWGDTGSCLIGGMSSNLVIKNIVFMGARGGSTAVEGFGGKVDYTNLDSSGSPWPNNLEIDNSAFFDNVDGILADDCGDDPDYLTGQYDGNTPEYGAGAEAPQGWSNPWTNGACTITLRSDTFVSDGNGDTEEHDIYIDRYDQLNIFSSYFGPALYGHMIKTRAFNTDIENTAIFEGSFANENVPVELPNGGNLTFKNNWFELGPYDQAGHFVDYDTECTGGGQSATTGCSDFPNYVQTYTSQGINTKGPNNPGNTVVISGNTFVDDWDGSSARGSNPCGESNLQIFNDLSANQPGTDGVTRAPSGQLANVTFQNNHVWSSVIWSGSSIADWNTVIPDSTNDLHLLSCGMASNEGAPITNGAGTSYEGDTPSVWTVPWPPSGTTLVPMTLQVNAQGANGADQRIMSLMLNGQIVQPDPTTVPLNGSTFNYQVNVLEPTVSGTSINNYLVYGNYNGNLDITSWTLNGQPAANESQTPAWSALGAGSASYWNYSTPVQPPSDTTPPVLGPSTTLDVQTGQSASLPLSATDPDNTPVQLTYTVSAAPTLGTLKLNGTAIGVGGKFTQADVTAGNVVYVAGSTTGTDSVGFSVADPAGNSVSGTLPISISASPPPADTTPPVVGSLTPMTVNAGTTTVVTAENLNATDPDNTADQLTYSIAALPSSSGAILKNGVSVTSWTQADVNAGSISYQAPSAAATVAIGFTVSDPAGNNASGTLNITVMARDTTAPTLPVPAPLSVIAFNSVALAFSATDPDNTADQITFTVVTPPARGSIVKEGVSVSNFTQQDVANNLVSYSSTGTVGSDSFVVKACDVAGNCSASVTQAVTVTADTTPPVLTAPSTVTLSAGATVTLAIKATDPDNGTSHLTYSVKTAPAYGVLKVNGVAGSTWTQAQMDAGDVTYTSTGSVAASDSFGFTITDPSGNFVSGTQSIAITAPAPAGPTLSTPSLTIRVKAGETVVITGLSATDPNYPAANLTYSLVGSPADGAFEKAGATVTTWTEADLEAGSISYVSTGPGEAKDVVQFTVSDPGSKSAAGQMTFVITPTVPGVITYSPGVFLIPRKDGSWGWEH